MTYLIRILYLKFYADAVKMWVFEEMVDGKKLTEIINETHENVKYLKGMVYKKTSLIVLFWSDNILLNHTNGLS